MRIRIDYLADTREALITTDDTGNAWVSVIRASQDNSDAGIKSPDDNQITLPWWAFLLAKESIGYHLARNKAQVEFSPEAKRLLQQAAQTQRSYQKVVESPGISEEMLLQKLAVNGFVRKLTKEQTNNVEKLGALRACATFSVPGAGKTTEALAYFCCQRGPQTKLLIVCPKNAFAVWEEQTAEIFREKPVVVRRLTGGMVNILNILREQPPIALITYQQLPFVNELIADYLLRDDVFVFLDESHRMKRGDSGVIGSTILSLSHLPSAKLIMTGTPLPNGIADLIPQFRFLYPEIPADAQNVKELIKPIYVRTTKNQLNIPLAKRIATNIPLAPAQRTLYQLLCSEYALENHTGLQAADRRKLRSLGKSALRLIQLVSNPALLARKSNFEHMELLSAVLEEGDSPKLEYATRKARVLAAQGKKTIIWSCFIGNVELIASRLFDLGADYIHGGVEAGSEEEENTRERKIKRFHDDKNAFVLVANPAACSESISLHTVCHHAIYIDRNYNAAQYLQSEDRIHRLGLKPDQETIIEVLCSPDTIDVAVAERLSRKIKLMGEVLDDPDLLVDPIPYDPDDDDEFDKDDALSFLHHIKTEAQSR